MKPGETDPSLYPFVSFRLYSISVYRGTDTYFGIVVNRRVRYCLVATRYAAITIMIP